jgi:hypothetical protein
VPSCSPSRSWRCAAAGHAVRELAVQAPWAGARCLTDHERGDVCAGGRARGAVPANDPTCANASPMRPSGSRLGATSSREPQHVGAATGEIRENEAMSRLRRPLRLWTRHARLPVAAAVGVFSLAGLLVGLATADGKSAVARLKRPTAQQYEQAILQTQKEIEDLQNEIGQELGVDVAVLVVLSPYELPLVLHCLLVGKDVQTASSIERS